MVCERQVQCTALQPYGVTLRLLSDFDFIAGYQTQSLVGKGLNFLVVVPTGHCPGGQVPWPNGEDGIATATALALTMFKGRSGGISNAVSSFFILVRARDNSSFDPPSIQLWMSAAKMPILQPAQAWPSKA
jgi:hypothetical protein